jgi:opacity protein-like surface antigen
MKKSGIACAVLLASTTGAYAQSSDNESGLYLGAGWGAYDVQIDDIDDTDEAIQRIDDDDNAWRVFAGWRFNPYVSFEIAYIDFGEVNDRLRGEGSSGDYRLELSGVQPAVYLGYPLGPVEIFGKLGYYFYDVDLRVDLDDLGGDVFTSDASEEAWSYGAGIGITLMDHLFLKVEYEKIDTDVIDDLDSIWLMAAWRF